ncbi:Hypothetical predicted protein [Paramuricea clavata]|uniref:Uncharacterized protein n=1 Tax=Paramuricea clavata TaxID=317549 RepID=A0A7D9J057_PARCT|nr:Hypothetical predicted protein [Paramuricea clavata]
MSHGLQSVRDAIILARAGQYISDAEFILLFDYNWSKPLFPYWKFDEFNMDTWDNEECRTELRFAKGDLPVLKAVLGVPDKITCQQGTTCSGDEALCILLKRFAYPCRYSDMVSRFGRNPSELCLIFNEGLDFLYERHHHRLQSWNQPFLSPEILQIYADAIHNKGAPLNNCFGFVDGTVRQIARPKYHQRVMYNGHKRVHSIKFQSVVLPNGLIGNLAGPYEGKRHDSMMLQESGLLTNLRQIAFYNNNPLCIYGDPAYPLGVHLQAPFRERELTPAMAEFNREMSRVRVSVEWMFGNITKYFSFLDFKRQMKLHLSPVGKIYTVAALLQNAHTCLYENIVSHFFYLKSPSIHEYFW